MPSSKQKWKFRIDQILESIECIQEFTKDLTYREFIQNRLIRDGVLMNFIIIGEAANCVPDYAVNKYPEIPWKKMRGLRNAIAHEYNRISLEIVWTISQRELSPLIPLLRRVLEEAQEEESDG